MPGLIRHDGDPGSVSGVTKGRSGGSHTAPYIAQHWLNAGCRI